MNEIQLFSNEKLGVQVRTIVNNDGSISLNAEDTAKGFGWSRTEIKNGKEYISIMWSRMNEYCKEFGFAHLCAKGDYIPESLFYMLGMKANNDAALEFQKWLAIDVLPSLRKTGTYTTKNKTTYTRRQRTLSSVNTAMKIIMPQLEAAGLSPVQRTYFLKDAYEPVGISLPVIRTEQEKLYELTEIAKVLGVYSESGKPHAQAIGAILHKLDINEDDIVQTSYMHNGHTDTAPQYKESVLKQVEEWLTDNEYPKAILGRGKSYKVSYKKLAPVI